MDSSTSAYVGKLVGTNNVVNDEISTRQDMIVKLHNNGEIDLFMMYQKTEGITEDIHSDHKITFNNHVVIMFSTWSCLHSKRLKWGYSSCSGMFHHYWNS